MHNKVLYLTYFNIDECLNELILDVVVSQNIIYLLSIKYISHNYSNQKTNPNETHFFSILK
jgi:hypothetical protein